MKVRLKYGKKSPQKAIKIDKLSKMEIEQNKIPLFVRL